MSRYNPFLTVIVPVFNESRRIHNLSKIIKFLKSQDFSREIIVINDGSTDNTLEKLQKYILFIKLISYSHNQGKGYAIKQGILSAKGKFILFMDIDLSTHPKIFNKFKSYLRNNPIIIGSRRSEGAKFTRHQPIVRENLGRCFTALSNIFLQLNISDFTCGFKCFSKKVAKQIFSKTTIKRWGFDSEALYISKKMGLPVLEVPVIWRDDPRTKVKFPKDIIASFLDLCKIRLNDLRGLYD